MISSRCSSWTCTTQPWWRSQLDVIHHGLYEIFLLMQAHGKIPNPILIYHTHISWVSSQSYMDNCLPYHEITWSHKVHLLALCVDQLLALSLDQPCIFIMMMSWRWTCVHTILFFKTCLRYAQHYYDQSLDIFMNNTLVITWSSWIQHMEFKHCLWTNSTRISQFKH